MKVVEDVEKTNEGSVCEGIQVREKLVAWCVVWWASLLCVWEREKRAAVGTFLWSWYFLFCIRTRKNRRQSGFPERLLPKPTFFHPFFQPSLLSPFTAKGVSLENMVMLLRHEDTRRHSHTHSNKNTNTHLLTHRSVHQARITVWLSSETSNGLQRENGSGKKYFSSSPKGNLTPRLQWHIPTHQAMTGWIYKEKQTWVVRLWHELFFFKN